MLFRTLGNFAVSSFGIFVVFHFVVVTVNAAVVEALHGGKINNCF